MVVIRILPALTDQSDFHYRYQYASCDHYRIAVFKEDELQDQYGVGGRAMFDGRCSMVDLKHPNPLHHQIS
jgi:hypothetical protein